jgi:hypothetical protein
MSASESAIHVINPWIGCQDVSHVTPVVMDFWSYQENQPSHDVTRRQAVAIALLGGLAAAIAWFDSSPIAAPPGQAESAKKASNGYGWGVHFGQLARRPMSVRISGLPYP